MNTGKTTTNANGLSHNGAVLDAVRAACHRGITVTRKFPNSFGWKIPSKTVTEVISSDTVDVGTRLLKLEQKYILTHSLPLTDYDSSMERTLTPQTVVVQPVPPTKRSFIRGHQLVIWSIIDHVTSVCKRCCFFPTNFRHCEATARRLL